MQVRKIVISTTVGLGMGAMAFAGAGAASADGGHGQDGGSGAVTVSSTRTTTNVASGNSFLNGLRLANGNRVANGNKVVLNVNVSILNGSPILSNNILNSGANSFNSSVTNIRASNSFNTVTVTHNEVTTNNTGPNGHAGQPGGGWEH